MSVIISSDVHFRISFILAESIFGTILNIILLIALYKSYRTLTPSNFLYYLLLISDTVFLLITSSAYIILLITRLHHTVLMCQIIGFSIQAFEGMGLAFVSLQMLNPFKIIVLETSALSVRQLAWLVATTLIIVGLLAPSLPWISGDAYKPLPSGTWCYANYMNPLWGTEVIVIISLVILALTPALLAIGYIWIYLKMRRWRGKETKDKEVQWFIIRRGFLLTCTVFAVWIFPIYMIASSKGSGRIENDFYMAVCVTASNVLNPVLLFLSHKKIRKTVYGWFYWICGREMKSSDNTLSSSTSNNKNRPSIAARLLKAEPNSPPTSPS